jgi:hypothetical protein
MPKKAAFCYTFDEKCGLGISGQMQLPALQEFAHHKPKKS